MILKKNTIFGLIGSLRERYSKFLEKELKACGIEGLVGSHGAIFACLYQNGGQMKVLEIGRWIGRSKSTVTELINRLESLGYVSKVTCCLDGRCTYVALTDQGRAVKDHFDKISSKLIDKAYKGFSEEEKEALLKGLERMWKNF